MKILKEIRNSPFLRYNKRCYLGKVKFGTPYFHPRNYCSTIIKIKKLENKPKFSSCKNWKFKIFNKSYWIEIGFPIIFRWITLGWKDKYNSPRCEWQPFFTFYFFKYQFCLFFISPEKEDIFEKYWEMFLWWRYYSNKDLKKAEETWGWTDIDTGKSTWDKKYLKMNNKTFIVKYSLDNFTKKVRVKRCLDKIHAELKSSEYIKKQNPNSKFRIISVEEENDILSNLFNFSFKK